MHFEIVSLETERMFGRGRHLSANTLFYQASQLGDHLQLAF